MDDEAATLKGPAGDREASAGEAGAGESAGLDARLAGVERTLEQMQAGLGLLGVRRCVRCGRFLRTTQPGALFDGGGGEMVCFECLVPWWSARLGGLSDEDRRRTELAMTRWLVVNHGAEIMRRPEEIARLEPAPRIKLVVGCEQCNSSGKDPSGGRPCGRCNGRGTVWVVLR
jgi:hypothetical protein